MHITCVLLMQTKNVTGRKLVGLRWWNEANDTGSAWRFEQAPEVGAHSLGLSLLFRGAGTWYTQQFSGPERCRRHKG